MSPIRSLLTDPETRRPANRDPSPLPRLVVKVVVGILAGCVFGAVLAFMLYAMGLL